jgi:hypothetical protein
MADARCIPKSVMLIKQICVHVQSWSAIWREKKTSQNMKFVMTNFLLETDFLQLYYRGFACTSYVWLLTFNKTQKIV